MAIQDAARLLAALKVEQQHQYCDLKGNHARFSDFIQDEIGQLLPKAPVGEGQALFADLKGAFSGYPRLDQAERAKLIARLRAAVPLLRAQQSLPLQAPSKEVTQLSPGQRNGAAGWGDDPVTTIKGVGSYVQKALERMGIHTVRELVSHYPRSYLDYQQRTHIRDLKPGQLVTLWGTIKRAEAFSPPRRPNMSINTVWISDGTGMVAARWFMGKATRGQQEAWKNRFPPGNAIIVSGEVKRDSYGGRLVFERPESEVLGPGDEEEETDSLHVGRIVPVYALTEGLHQKTLRRGIHEALTQAAIAEPLPPDLLARFDLQPLPAALKGIHFPESIEERNVSRRRLVFEELFWLQLGLAYKRAQLALAGGALALPPKAGGLVDRLLASLPFTLTGAQVRVFDEIRRDLAADDPMNRLVQGDVGSGKTVVALLSLLHAVDDGYQGAVMAPTEILAEQHHQTFKRLLEPLGVQVAYLVGKQTKRDRDGYLKALRTGFCKIAIGTHALIQEGVEFERLGLVVIDEQHRFGVRQRALLRAKGHHVEVLTMTATPIPRTLALVAYGDLDVSAIDELPPGRTPVRTQWLRGRGARKQTWDQVKEQIGLGHQAYVVFPLVEESEKIDVRAATEEFKRLGAKELAGYRLGLLHGQMPSEQKEAAISAFRRHELEVLVSTTVIEVGVDVPNASIMVVENAERFGLSQLHQLRGRVGRGAAESHCILLTDGDGEATKQRMEIMCATNDGFIIAQKDLEIRGPGEFIGTRQSGMPDLVLANLATDGAVLEEARRAAFDVVAKDPDLKGHPQLEAGMLAAYAQNLGFLGIG